MIRPIYFLLALTMTVIAETTEKRGTSAHMITAYHPTQNTVQTIHVPVPHPIPVPVPQPISVPVSVPRPFPVTVQRTVGLPVPVGVPVPIHVPVPKPYPVPVPVNIPQNPSGVYPWNDNPWAESGQMFLAGFGISGPSSLGSRLGYGLGVYNNPGVTSLPSASGYSSLSQNPFLHSSAGLPPVNPHLLDASTLSASSHLAKYT